MGVFFLKTDDFNYDLPEHLIATVPAPRRDASRLLILNKATGKRNHCVFSDILNSLRPNSLLVVNDTQVIPARLAARKPSGGRVEVFLVEPCAEIPPPSDTRPWSEDWRTLVRGLGHFPLGGVLTLADGVTATLLQKQGRGASVWRFAGDRYQGLLAAAKVLGRIPLPPYIEAARKVRAEAPSVDDGQRYQTVFARMPGAVAAPTAGLHFTPELMARLTAAGHAFAPITLHVGPGTFRPVSTPDPSQHRLDAERFWVSEDTAAQIEAARSQGRPIVAVGTTVVRTLETLGRKGAVQAGQGSTELLILPGDPFHVVTDLLTNFHLPKSSLLMLVSAFAGRESVLAAYQDAVDREYRFYSYGDAMFIRGGDNLP